MEARAGTPEFAAIFASVQNGLGAEILSGPCMKLGAKAAIPLPRTYKRGLASFLHQQTLLDPTTPPNARVEGRQIVNWIFVRWS